MEINKNNNNFHIRLSSDEALVLFDWLAKFNGGAHSSLFEDQSEERLLFDLEASLEELITTVFNHDYKRLLIEARNRLKDPD